MQDLHLTVTIISFLTVISGLLLKKIEAVYLNEPFLAMAAGILFGPLALNVLDVNNWGEQSEIMIVVCRFTIGMALMATALRLPPYFILKNKQTQSIILLLLLPLMCIVSALIFYLLMDIPFLLALLIGAVVTPTDPVAAVSIVSGDIGKKTLPENIRKHLSFEAGANDGLAFPLVLLPLVLLQDQSLFTHWFLKGILWETIAGIIFGLGFGYLAGKMLHKANNSNALEQKTLLAFSIGVAFAIMGLFELLQLNSIVGVFAAGVVLNSQISKNENFQEERVQESMQRLFTLPVYFFLGLILPFQQWFHIGWMAVVIALLVILLRRIPAVFLVTLFTKDLNEFKEKLIFGWIGPVGVAAIFYAFYTATILNNMIIWEIASLIIFSSTILHGLLSLLFAQLLFKAKE